MKEQVYRILQSIPRGQVVTYAQIAKMLGTSIMHEL